MTISFARAPPDGVAPSATLCQHAGVALTRALESARFRMAEVSSLFVSVCHRPTLKEYHDMLLILKHDGTSMCLLATSLRSVPRHKVSRFPFPLHPLPCILQPCALDYACRIFPLVNTPLTAERDPHRCGPDFRQSSPRTLALSRSFRLARQTLPFSGRERMSF